MISAVNSCYLVGSVGHDVSIAGECSARLNEYVDSESDTAGDICERKLLRIHMV